MRLMPLHTFKRLAAWQTTDKNWATLLAAQLLISDDQQQFASSSPTLLEFNSTPPVNSFLLYRPVGAVGRNVQHSFWNIPVAI